MEIFKRLPPNSFSHETISMVTTFINNYGRAHGLPLPGRVPGHRDKVILLPSDITKAHVYQKYKEACNEKKMVPVGRSRFYSVWQELLPQISISTPSTDLCFTCQQNRLAIQLSGHLSDEEKTKRIDSAQEHLSRAKAERDYYNQQVVTAETSFSAASEENRKPLLAHYSFDFAQQVHYPYDSQQTGPEYFKTARKCGLFGVCNDGEKKQVLYLIDEAENPGKGADCVISLVHHYLESHGSGEEAAYLHADNCTGQNKNNAFVQYLTWRTLTGQHDSMLLSFMLVGHTKFSPDRFFGLFKKAFRRSSVSTMIEIAGVAERCTNTGQVIPQVVRSTDGVVLVKFYKWTEYLNKYFRAVPNILSYHQFSVSADNLGVVKVRQYSDSTPIDVNIFKSGITQFTIAGFPAQLLPPGLDINRQWYLYEQIRPHCKSTLAADITCPKPSMPKPSKNRLATTATSTSTAEETLPTSMSTSSSPTKKIPTSSRKRCCSKCKQPGHNKKKCPNN